MEFEVNGGKNGEIPWEKGRILLRGFIKEAFKALIITWIPAFAGMTRMGACSAESIFDSAAFNPGGGGDGDKATDRLKIVCLCYQLSLILSFLQKQNREAVPFSSRGLARFVPTLGIDSVSNPTLGLDSDVLQ